MKLILIVLASLGVTGLIALAVITYFLWGAELWSI